MLMSIEEKVVEKSLDLILNAVENGIRKLPEAVFLCFPNAKSKYTQRRFKNAQAALEAISDELDAYGLKVDYKSYFEKELKIPLELMSGLSEEEDPSLRDLLQRLFAKHLSGQFDNDSFYPAFIAIIKTISPIEVAVLKSMYEVLQANDLWNTPNCTQALLQIGKSNIMSEFHVDELTLNAALANLERHQLITTIHPTKGINMGSRAAASIGDPALTPLGILFIKACMEDLEKAPR